MVFEDLSGLEAMAAADDTAAVERLWGGGPQRARWRPPYIRSALMLSTHNLRHLNRLDALEADMVVLNLEDGVAPSQKPMALRLAALFLSRLRTIRSLTVVRVNPLDEGGAEEIALLNRVRPDAIRVPKIRGPEEVERALELIDPAIAVHLSVETAGAWLTLDRLRVDRRVEALYLGVLDLLADVGLPQRIVARTNPTMRSILARFLMLVSAQGALPVSFVYQNHRDLEGFEAWCRLEREMGYHAKGCISPRQVTVANALFGPEPEELARAERIVALFESDPDRSGFADDELGFVDEPVYKAARGLLQTFGERGDP